MRVNIFWGFFTPWLLAVWLLRRQEKLIVTIVPFVWVVATAVNVWGDKKKFWLLKPKLKKNQYLTTMPLNLGLYPILSVVMVYLIKKTENNYILWVTIFSFLTTAAEFCAVLLGKAQYNSGWNTLKTFFSYLIPYYLVYRYYLWIIKVRFFL